MLTATPQDLQFNDQDHEEQVRRYTTPPPMQVVVEERKSTDSSCAFLFAISQFAMVIVATFVMIRGNQDVLGRPLDPDHKSCGIDLPNYPNIYFVTPQSKQLYRTVCVSKCPTSETTVLSCSPNSIVTSCTVNPSVSDLEHSVLAYDTIESHNICIPLTEYYYSQLAEHLYPGFPQQAAKDTRSAQGTIILWVFVSFILSILFLVLFERFTAPTIWALIIMILIISGGASAATFQIYYFLSKPSQLPEADTDQLSPQQIIEATSTQINMEWVFLVVAVVLLLVFLFTLLGMIVFRKRIQLTIMMVRVTSDFTSSNMLLFIVPLILFIVLFAYFIVWLQVGLLIYASFPVSDQPNSLPFDQVVNSPLYIVLACQHFFAFYWFTCFTIGTMDFITSGSVVEWYFRQAVGRGESDVQPVKLSWDRFRTYNWGSVALASLLIGLTSFISLIAETIERAKRQLESTVFSFVMLPCFICTFCFENLLQYINKYTYVMMNLNGTNFANSSKDATDVMYKHSDMFSLVGGLGETVMMLGRVFISLLCTYQCFMECQDLRVPYIPALICFVFKIVMSFSVSSLFMSVYSMSAEAINLVYHQGLSDEEIPQATQSFQNFLQSAKNF